MSKQLSPNPSIHHLKKQAKALLKHLKAGSTEACDRVRSVLPRWQHITDNLVLQAEVSLRDAQQVIARDYNFTNWQQMTAEVNRAGGTPAYLLANAIESQDTKAIADLMAKHPNLFDEDVSYNALSQALRDDPVDLIRRLLETRPQPGCATV